MDARMKKPLLIAGIAALALFIIILSAMLISSCSADSKYEKNYEQAEKYYDRAEYDRALTAIQKALAADERPQAYLLMAEILFSMGNLDKAIETLYIASYKFSDPDISERLEELKALKLETDVGIIIIGGKEVAVDETVLDLSQLRLTDISDLSKLTELQSLTLEDNGISDITPLSSLTKLTYLHLGNNKIIDLQPLSGLNLLKTLYLDGNPVEDFSPLYSLSALNSLSIREIKINQEQLDTLKEKLTGCRIYSNDPEDDIEELTLGGVTFMSDVTELDLGNLGITDISVLEKCTKLQKLDLRSNSVTDLTPLSELEELSWLCIWNNKVSNLMPLSFVKTLTYLDADGNNITSITALASLTGLEELWLSHNSIAGFSTLKGLTALRRLGLKSTGLTDADLDNIKSLANLKELALDDNDKLTGEAVEKLKTAMPNCYITHSELIFSITLGGVVFKSDATEISVNSSNISDISVLERFTKLKTLMLNGNKITDISVLANMPDLETLELGSDSLGNSNTISNLSPLAGLTKLKSLNLTQNKITDISALFQLTGLSTLNLSGNSLSSISTLSGLTGLRVLSLDYCGLSDISALSGLTGITHLALEGNKINDISALRGMTALKELYIGSNLLTYDQVAQLKADLPNCSIYSDVQPPATPPIEPVAESNEAE